jgi:hypothetical protein
MRHKLPQYAPIAPNLGALRTHIDGKTIAFVQVCGINSLKTVDPPLPALAGDVVVDLVTDEQARSLHVVLGNHVLILDLARTGTATTLQSATTWSPTDGQPMPTVRIGFTDHTGLDLKEPAKTKRITLTIAPTT